MAHILHSRGSSTLRIQPSRDRNFVYPHRAARVLGQAALHTILALETRPVTRDAYHIMFGSISSEIHRRVVLHCLERANTRCRLLALLVPAWQLWSLPINHGAGIGLVASWSQLFPTCIRTGNMLGLDGVWTSRLLFRSMISPEMVHPHFPVRVHDNNLRARDWPVSIVMIAPEHSRGVPFRDPRLPVTKVYKGPRFPLKSSFFPPSSKPFIPSAVQKHCPSEFSF